MSQREERLRRENLRLSLESRKKQLYLRVCSVMLLCLVVISCVSICTLISKAGSHGSAKKETVEKTISYKYYTTVTVATGETLWDIAKKYSSEEFGSIENYIREVKSINHISGDRICAGEALTVPYYSGEYKY